MLLKIICGALVVKNEKFVIVQEAQELVRDQWNIPAGHLDVDENLHAGAIREIKEETGLDVKIEGLIGVYQHKSKLRNNIVGFYFHASVSGGELKTDSDEIMDVKWVTFENFLNYNDEIVRAPHLKEVVKDYMKLGSVKNRIYIEGL